MRPQKKRTRRPQLAQPPELRVLRVQVWLPQGRQAPRVQPVHRPPRLLGRRVPRQQRQRR